MERPLAEMLELSVAAAERQIVAARSMDVDALRDATAQRQDLLFELGLADLDELEHQVDPVVRDLVVRLQALDQRLEKILQAALNVFGNVLPQRGQPATYAPDGRMKGGAG